MAWGAGFNHRLPPELCTEGLLGTGVPKCCRGKFRSVRVQERLVPSLGTLGDTCPPPVCLEPAGPTSAQEKLQWGGGLAPAGVSFMPLNMWGPIRGLAPPAANSEIPALALPGSPARRGDSYLLEQSRAGEHLEIPHKGAMPTASRGGPPRPKCTPTSWGPSTLTLK